MANIEKISFDLEVITPMFLSEADGKTAKLRPSSFKGLLRYWWRALQVENNMEMLKQNETKIFGSVDQGGSFSIQIKHSPFEASKEKFLNHSVEVDGKNFKINILEYLVYGTYEYERGRGNIFKREYIPPGTRFNVIINISKKDLKEEILKTFYVFSLFGGVGSRNRNGFGSFDVSNKDKAFNEISTAFSIDKPYQTDNLRKLVKTVDVQPYSSFSKQTKVFRTKELFDSWDKALAKVGTIYRDSRLKLEGKHSYEKRQYIGAPIVEGNITRSFLDRHAKPYFLRISKESNKFRGYILYLPSRYCHGLDKDINNNTINHTTRDNEFMAVCEEFNQLLASKIDVIFGGF